MSKLKFTLEEYQEAAVKYREDLLMLPIRKLDHVMKFMTGRPGIRYAERVGDADADAEMAPYSATRKSGVDLDLNFRTLYTFFGSCVKEFEPNSAIGTLLGKGATKGDGQAQTPTALMVLALIAKKISNKLYRHFWDAVRNPAGDSTKDLFDGFDTITAKEIAAGNISAAKGNYLKIDEKITRANAVEIAKRIMYALDDELRESDEPVYIYCTQHFVDMYNEGYKLETGNSPLYDKYGQLAVEGSNGMLVFCPLSNKRGSEYFHVSPKSNMLVGYDQMGDEESIEVARFSAFLLQYIATMFFGVQFESIDPRRLMVVHVPQEAKDTERPVRVDEKPVGPPELEGEGDGDGDGDGGDSQS